MMKLLPPIPRRCCQNTIGQPTSTSASPPAMIRNGASRTRIVAALTKSTAYFTLEIRGQHDGRRCSDGRRLHLRLGSSLQRGQADELGHKVERDLALLAYPRNFLEI